MDHPLRKQRHQRVRNMILRGPARSVGRQARRRQGQTATRLIARLEAEGRYRHDMENAITERKNDGTFDRTGCSRGAANPFRFRLTRVADALIPRRDIPLSSAPCSPSGS